MADAEVSFVYKSDVCLFIIFSKVETNNYLLNIWAYVCGTEEACLSNSKANNHAELLEDPICFFVTNNRLILNIIYNETT